jgi:4-hydroxybenzoate polyprenyltransferase
MSNAYAGYFIGGGRIVTPALAAGIAAAALFIMAGMALNDIADKDVDAKERPNRPIPSGAVPLGQAWAASLAMMAGGLLLLAWANPISAAVGAALCGAVFLYNFVLKGTFLGPASMGLCRLLNLLTGVSLTWAVWPRLASFPKPLLIALLSLWAFIALVTFLAKDEVQGNSRRRARLFLIGFAAWMIAWSLVIWLLVRPDLPAAAVWLLLALNVREPLRNLAKDPSPKHTGQAVGGMLRLVPVVDVMAMLACAVPPLFAFWGLFWIVPAIVVGKKFYST